MITGDINHVIRTALNRIYDAIGHDISNSFNVNVSLTHSTTAQQVKAAVTDNYHYITDISISTDSAGWVEIQDDTGTPNVLISKKYLPANSVWSKHYKTPIKVPVGKKIMIDSSLSSGNLSVDVNGFTSTSNLFT